MRKSLLMLDDLINALQKFQRYGVIAVFASDVYEVLHRSPVPGLSVLGADTYRLVCGDKSYTMELFCQKSVLHLKTDSSQPESEAESSSVIEANRDRGERDVPGMPLLGVLVGSPISEDRPELGRLIFTMTFEPATREWISYGGGLLPWMKEKLLGTERSE